MWQRCSQTCSVTGWPDETDVRPVLPKRACDRRRMAGEASAGRQSTTFPYWYCCGSCCGLRWPGKLFGTSRAGGDLLGLHVYISGCRRGVSPTSPRRPGRRVDMRTSTAAAVCVLFCSGSFAPRHHHAPALPGFGGEVADRRLAGGRGQYRKEHTAAGLRGVGASAGRCPDHGAVGNARGIQVRSPNWHRHTPAEIADGYVDSGSASGLASVPDPGAGASVGPGV